jgi:uncharacterized membrane protein required for colicin V production
LKPLELPILQMRRQTDSHQMNGVDLVLVVVLAGCAVRGWWRGFVRECFGLLALVVGISVALRCTAGGEAVLQPHLRLPAPIGSGIAFVAIFAVVHAALNVTGVLLSRLTATAVLGTVNGIGGALLGAGKGAVVLAFLLLFFHLFPVVAAIDPQVMGSRIGRPLLGVASNAIRIGVPADAANRT